MSELNGQCAGCKVQVKDWVGDDPVCSFQDGTFKSDGWNCVTAKNIRDVLKYASHPGVTINETSDQKHGTISTCDVEVATWSDDEGWESPNPVCLWVGWYKNRGSTEGMYLMFENLPPRPPTEEECLKIIEHYKCMVS